MSERTFKVGNTTMRGKDVKAWQADVDRLFAKMKIDCPIKIDGIYGQATRSYSAALCRAMGLKSAEEAMKDGVTPQLRIKLRNENLTAVEKKLKTAKARVAYRRALRERWRVTKVHAPVSKIITDDWGWTPGVHDGVDVICATNAACFAMAKSKVVDVRAGGWWGKAPSGDVTKGDGIVQLRVLETVGPFKKGMHIGYGHCEHARVKVGDVVQAGEVIALAGLAVVTHIHLMVNRGANDKTPDGRKVGTRGVGTLDPRPLLDYAVKNG